MKREKIMGTTRWLYWVSIGVVLILLYKFLDNFTGIGNWIKNLFGVLAPFLVSIIIAYCLYNPCKKVEAIINKNNKVKYSRFLSITIVYLITGVLLFILLRFIVPAFVEGIIDLVDNLQIYYNGIKMNEIQGNWAPFIQENILKPLVEAVQKMDFKTMLSFEKLGDYIKNVVGIFNIFVDIFIALICSIRILYDREKIVGFIKKLASASMKESRYKKFDRYFTNGNRFFLKFISSQFLDALVVATLMSFIMIIMNVKYGIILGTLIGVFNLIPFFGAIVAVIISVIITILTGGWQQALILLVVITIVQQIDANIINPKITGTSLEISPLLVVFAVAIGGAYFGIIGMFVAVPITVLLKLMIEDFMEERENRKKEKIEKLDE